MQGIAVVLKTVGLINTNDNGNTELNDDRIDKETVFTVHQSCLTDT